MISLPLLSVNCGMAEFRWAGQRQFLSEFLIPSAPVINRSLEPSGLFGNLTWRWRLIVAVWVSRSGYLSVRCPGSRGPILVIEPRRVFVSHLHRPMPFGEHAIYIVIFVDGTYYSCARQPPIFDARALPMTLSCELAAGSVLRCEVDGPILRAVMVQEMMTVNPFAEYAQAD